MLTRWPVTPPRPTAPDDPETRSCGYVIDDGVPDGVDVAAVGQLIASTPGVVSVHDLHIWPMSTTETALTAHLTMPAGHPGDPWIHALAGEMAGQFGIGHVTIQVETDDAGACVLHPEEVV